MKWKLAFALLFVPSLGFSASKDKFQSLLTFSGGLNSYYSSLTIGDTEVKDCRNVYFDIDNAVQKRKGFSLWGSVSSGPVLNSWQFTDTANQGWIIIRTSTAIYASPASGGFTSKIATVSATVGLVSEVNAQNKAFFVDRADGVFTWDGTTTTYIAGSPLGNVIAEFHGRVWVAGAANPNQNVLYGSKYGDGTTWTVSFLTVSDPVQLTIGLNDNADGITTLFSGLNDVLYCFKNLSINGLYGFDGSDFQSRMLTRDAGCIDPQTLQSFKGTLTFLSRRGLESFDGTTTMRISDKIKDRIDSCISNDIGSYVNLSWTQDTAADWGLGVSSVDISTSVSLGDVIAKTSYYINTTAVDWGAGTFTGNPGFIDTQTVSGTLRPVWPETFDTDRSIIPFGNANGNNIWSAQSSGGGSFSCSFSVSAGSITININSSLGLGSCNWGSEVNSQPLASGVTFYWRVENDYINGGTDLYTQVGITTEPASGNRISYNKGADSGAYKPTWDLILTPCNVSAGVKGIIVDQSDAKNDSLTSISGCIPVPADLSLYLNSSSYQTTLGTSTVTGSHTIPTTLGGYPFMAPYVIGTTSSTEIFSHFGISPQTFTWTNTTGFDSGILNPFWSYRLTSSGDGTLVSSGSVSSDNITFDNGVVITSTSFPANAKQYEKTQLWFNVTSASQSPLVAYDFTVDAGSSGTFLTQLKNTTSINQWGNFDANTIQNGGTITFYIRASNGAFTILSSTPAWTLLNNHSVPSIAVGTEFQIRADFVNPSTGNVSLNNFNLQWNQGTLKPNAASIVYDDRYYLSCSTTSAGNGNDIVILLAQKQQPVFSIWDINAGSFVNFQNSLYHGDSNPTGNVYIDNQGYSDNHNPINAFIKTRDYALDGIIYDKLFLDLYLNADALGPYNIDSSYALDRATNTYSFPTVLQNEMPGFISVDLPFSLSNANPNIGRTISFTFQNNVADQPLNLYGGILNYKLKQEIRNLGK